MYEDNQFAKLKDYLLFLSSINVDALIIQDIGLMAYVKKYFPNFEIHMSTQASIYSLEAVKYFEKIGVERVVLARENSLQEIKNICNHTNLDIEVFVHGALCMSYSGQCLMSSMVAKEVVIKGRVVNLAVWHINYKKMVKTLIKFQVIYYHQKICVH